MWGGNVLQHFEISSSSVSRLDLQAKTPFDRCLIVFTTFNTATMDMYIFHVSNLKQRASQLTFPVCPPISG